MAYDTTMPLHIIKLCVGADSVDDLKHWIGARLSEQRRAGHPEEHKHTTRMTPKRREEVLDGGSLYWVIKGQIAVRQAMLDLRPFTDPQGIGRCDFVLDQRLVEVETRPRKAFQGWRYLLAHEAPPDVGSGPPAFAAFPEPLRRELRNLGLI